ncbi:MAG TPA: hypothetical protein VMD79_15960 [Solirubrobacteraceae bacterium]|nr:hypothetical protein [Solirubrobacteraceae bacterium]
MSASEDADAIAGLASDTVAPIDEELRGRLTVRLGERDRLAVESALLKAFLVGMQAGVAESAESESALEQAVSSHGEQVLLPAELSVALPQLDPWADRFGAG